MDAELEAVATAYNQPNTAGADIALRSLSGHARTTWEVSRNTPMVVEITLGTEAVVYHRTDDSSGGAFDHALNGANGAIGVGQSHAFYLFCQPGQTNSLRLGTSATVRKLTLLRAPLPTQTADPVTLS